MEYRTTQEIYEDPSMWPTRVGMFAMAAGASAAIIVLNHNADPSAGSMVVERDVVTVAYSQEAPVAPGPNTDLNSLLNLPDAPGQPASPDRPNTAGLSPNAVVDARQTDGGTAAVAGMLSVPDAILKTPQASPAAAPNRAPAPAPERAPAAPDVAVIGRRVNFFYQGDPQWANAPYHANGYSGKIGPNGCGPSTMAIVVSTLSDHKVTPIDMANWNMQHGYVDGGGATYHAALDNGPKAFGLSTYRIGKTVDEVRKVIDQGGMVITNGTDSNPATPATPGGHIFAIRGVTDNGRLLVADPNSFVNSTRKDFSPAEIFGAASIAIAVVNPHGAPEAPAPAPAPAAPAPAPAPTAEAPAPVSSPNSASTVLAIDGGAPSAPNEASPAVVAPPAADSNVDVGGLLSLGGAIQAQDKAEAAQAPAAPPRAPAPTQVSAPAPHAPAPETFVPAAGLPSKVELVQKFPKFNPDVVPKDYSYWIMLAADKYGLSPSILAAQLEAESGWREDVIRGKTDSNVGAKGIAQFMPETWKSHAVDADHNGTTSPLDPPDAIMAQGHFMRVLLDQLKGIPGDPIANALAGYNAGGGRVVQFNGIPPQSFADGQTYYYVRNILAGAHKYEK